MDHHQIALFVLLFFVLAALGGILYLFSQVDKDERK